MEENENFLKGISVKKVFNKNVELEELFKKQSEFSAGRVSAKFL